MKKQNDYLKNKLAELEDESFITLLEETLDAKGELAEVNDDIVHISLIDDKPTEYITTGYKSLDRKMGGLGKGHVILIGGETSNGKSALATNIAVNISRDYGVLFITLEMLHTELMQRIKICNGGTVDGLDIMFQKEFRLTYKDIEPTVKNAIKMGSVDVVILDYLQYLGRGMSLQEVAVMSKEIKTIALKYEVPILVIVSLRKGEGGANKRKWTDIEIQDFMGTGAIGYDCDSAMIVSRKDLEDTFDPEHVFVKVLKTRNTKLDYNNRFIMMNWEQTKITDDFVEA